MGLEKYIEELLYDYECVTIPDFGAFLTRPYNFEIDKVNGKFIPPRKELTFNSLLTSNDGVLINYFAKKNNLKYRKAQILVQKEVENWRNQIKVGALIIENIGKITLSQNKTIEFEPFGKINFDENSFGLKIFTKRPINSSKQSKVFSILDEEKLVFTPKNDQINSFPKYAAVFLITLALTSTSLYFGDQYIQGRRTLNQQMAQNKIQENVQTATFNLGSLKSISLTVTNLKVENKTILNKTHYSIIAGTFRNRSYAIRKIENLKKKGYNSSLVSVNPKGMYRVAYERFESKKEALDLLYHIKYNLGEEGWYLKE